MIRWWLGGFGGSTSRKSWLMAFAQSNKLFVTELVKEGERGEKEGYGRRANEGDEDERMKGMNDRVGSVKTYISSYSFNAPVIRLRECIIYLCTLVCPTGSIEV